MSSQAVMITAQKLYEDGYITYMRTDSIHLSNEAINASRKAIEKSFGKNYIPEKPRVFKSKVKSKMIKIRITLIPFLKPILRLNLWDK